MAKLNTFKKYFVAISVSFLLCITAIVIIVSILINSFLSKEKMSSLNASCSAVSRFIESDYNSQFFKDNLSNMVRMISVLNDSRVIISDETGKIIACSCSDFAIDGVCNHSVVGISGSLINSADKRFEEIGKMGGVYKDVHYTAGRIVTDNNGVAVAYVFASSPASALTEFYGELFKLYAFAAIVPILILFFSLYTMTYRWIKPLKLMSEAAKAMAKGDFSRRIPVMSNDEIGMLSESFNSMTNSLVELENMRRSFIANVSHELKTPMTTIGGFIDGIIDGTIDSSKQDYYLKIVSDEVKRLSRLVQGMLNLSKFEAGEIKLKRSQFDLKNLILDVVLNQEQRIEDKKLRVYGLEGFENVTINADKDLIHQVIYNLCDNAIKFTNEGGQLKFNMKADSKTVEFTLENTGDGIPEKDLPLIFERFYKGDFSRSANKDSTGLGLYLVKNIIKLHGGKAFVKSTENVFTQFGIILPLNYTEE
ncbi:MAG: HAMP domain-containing sensor histidine kinase [Acutalibacteraceae bacterium]|nr:HAMP domain-containing sensor histidine kinase [Acutalibacteraceae bacterium]